MAENYPWKLLKGIHMKRQPFYILLLKGIGYIILGNILCMFMTMALSMFGRNIVFNILSIICGTLIFYMLIFTVAWKDGARERSLVKNRRVDAPLKYRWIYLGVIMYVIAALPTLVLLLNKLFFPEQDTLFEYRFISLPVHTDLHTAARYLNDGVGAHRLPPDRQHARAVSGADARVLRCYSGSYAVRVVRWVQ